MQNKDDIASILNAINEINLKPKKKNATVTTSAQRFIPKLNPDLIIPSDVDRLIREAEEFKKSSISTLKITPSQNQKIEFSDKDALILTEESFDDYEDKDQIITELNNKVKNLEEKEKKFRLQITNLQKDKILLSRIDTQNFKNEDSQDLINNTKETLKSIYKQVEIQKKLFLELKNYSIKIERDSNVYKENYERLIIENNDLKTRIKIAKEQITKYESNKNDLLSALDQLNEISSQSNIVGKIRPVDYSIKKIDPPQKKEIDPND